MRLGKGLRLLASLATGSRVYPGGSQVMGPILQHRGFGASPEEVRLEHALLT